MRSSGTRDVDKAIQLRQPIDGQWGRDEFPENEGRHHRTQPRRRPPIQPQAQARVALGMHVTEVGLDPHVAEAGAADPEGMRILGMDRALERAGIDARGHTRARPHALDLDPHAACHAACSRSAKGSQCLGGNCKIVYHLRDMGTAKANDDERPGDMTES